VKLFYLHQTTSVAASPWFLYVVRESTCMVRNIDSSYILYGIGALLGIAAILYFGQEVLLSLSPT
jgi:hypothetical protein